MKKFLLIITGALLAGAMAFAQDDSDWADNVRAQAEAAAAENDTDEVDETDTETDTDIADGSNDQGAPADSLDGPAPKPAKKKGSFHTPFPYRRWVEIGVDAGIGVANNFLGVSDMLKKNLEIDMTAIGSKVKEDGVKLGLNLDAAAFINVNLVEKWGFSIFSTVSGSVHLNLPKSIFTLIGDGNINKHSQSGSISAFGGIFADSGVDIHVRPFKDNRLKLSLIPTTFLPLVYIPKSSIGYKVTAGDELKIETEGGNIDIYSPFSLDTMNFSDANIADQMGFDLSLAGEYRLFPFLDVGAGIKNIPFVPAKLKNRMRMHLNEKTVVDGTGLAEGKEVEVNTKDLYKTTHDTVSPYWVVRPMRFDFYGMLKPFRSEIFIFKPDIGVTFLTPDEVPHFNFNLEAQLNTPVIILHASTGYEELLWRHRLLFGLNLRVLEIDIGLDMRSQDFVQSFKMNGAGITLGVRAGF